VSAGATARQPPSRSTTGAAATGAAATGAPTRNHRVTDAGADDTTTDARRLERDAAERILRRAVELDAAEDQGSMDHRISVQALLDAATELDIDAAEVRRAVVEEELGLLSTRRPRIDALVGPDRFVAVRVVEGTPAELTDRIDAWMCRGRVLRRSRAQPSAGQTPGWVDYARRNDPVAGAQRALHAVQGHERLAHVRRVRVVVSPLDERRCVVGLVVDASRSRRAVLAGGTATTAAGSLLSLDWVVAFGHPLPLAIGGAALSAMAGAGIMWSRRSWTDGVEDELEALLDAVESGNRPPSAIDGVTSRLMRPTRS